MKTIHLIIEKRLNRALFTIFIGFLFMSCGNIQKDKDKGLNQKTKPNIIYILADDLGYGDLSCYGQQRFSTPNIDQLAKDGMLFTQHYSGSTVCAPSRSTLMTGQHTGHTDIRGNHPLPHEGNLPLDSATVTVAELLKQAGYVTGAFGKWGLGYPGSEGDPNNQGFDTFYGYNCQRVAHNYFPSHLWDNQTKEILKGNEGDLEGDYAPTFIHNQVIKFIEDNKDTSFFLYYPTIIPHAELVAPEEYMAKFRGKLLPEKVFKSGKNAKRDSYDSQEESHAAFAAMITLLDDQVGQIRAKLEEYGIAQNTLIIFTSDNGPHHAGGGDPLYFNSNGGLRGIKGDFYEGGIRVPLVASWPGKIAPMSESDHVSAFWDFLPTACDIAEIDKPENIDGVSFLPELLDKKQPIHEFLYWEHTAGKGTQAVRYGKWKGVRLGVDTNPNAPVELYDLSVDNKEQNNLAAQYPEIVDRIAEIMNDEHTRSEIFSFSHEIPEIKNHTLRE